MKAVVLIDVQNDFVTGALGSKWAQEVVPRIAKFVNDIKDNPEYVIFATRDTHYDDYLNTLEGKKLPVPHCIKNTEGWEIVPEVKDFIDENNIVDKNTFMSCRILNEDMDLADIILDTVISRQQEGKDYIIDEIIICGFVTSICVVSNALKLRGNRPETRITVYDNLCADVSLDAHYAALTVMQNCQIDIKQY